MQPVPQPPEAKPAEQSVLEECLLALLRGMQNHVAMIDEAQGQEFRAQLAALEIGFQANNDPRELVDSAVGILEQHGAQLQQALAREKSGLAAASSELVQAIQALPGMQANAERWNHVEEQIKTISPQDDLDVMKARLCADVAVARAEALQERKKIRSLFSGALGRLEAPSAATAGEGQPEEAARKTDDLTGLPTRPQAEIELAHLRSQSADCFLALFVVKRLALINAKFGYARGDEVLRKVVLHLIQALPNFNNLFRWAPCAFITVAPATLSYKELRSRIQLIELARLTPTLEWEGRSAMVPVVLDCRIVSVKDFSTPADLFLRLDTLSADT